MCDSVNHTRLPGSVCQDNKGTKSDHVEHVPQNIGHQLNFHLTDHQILRCSCGEGSNHLKA